MMVKDVDERMTDIEDLLMARKEAEAKREKIKDHEERLREINKSLRRNNLCLIRVPEGAKRDRGKEAY